MSTWWDSWSPKLLALGEASAKAVGIFLVFWVAAKVIEILICRIHTGEASRDLVNVLGRAAKIALLIFGAITALGTAGLNVQALVAGLGLTGFALGFAFRDVLSNVLAGILILLYKPFVRGDYIITSGLEGVVNGIDLRYTSLAQEGKRILIPNSNLFTNPITITGHPPTERAEGLDRSG